MFHSKRRLRRDTALAAGALVVTLALAACSGSAGADADTGDASDIAKALQEKQTISIWTWAPAVEDIATAFEKKYPQITVDVVNVGTGNDHYVKLQNAIKAGSGAPDIAQMEYYALPQFALSDSLFDLTNVGFDSLEEKFTASTWGSVNVNGGLYGLPQDSGPMALFYNKAIFDEFGITVPATWDEYVEAAKKLHAADPTKYITNDVGDPGFTESMIWQAGGKPFVTTDSSHVAIDLQDAGSKKFADTWNQLIEGDLLAPIPTWSDEWYKALADGTVATLTTGAWMPGNLESGNPTGSGDWRVAPMPTWDGTPASAENGGGGDSILQQSKHKLAAAGFLQFMNEGEGAQISIASGGFASTTADLENPEFLDAPSEYFGGQKINQVLVQASKDVVPGWQYLPFQVYANSIFSDTVGQAYANKSDLNDGLMAWQNALVDYGNGQGFTVTAGK